MPETPPLPIPELPAGCVRITCEANIPGYEPTVLVLAPRVVAKLRRYAAEMYDYSQNPPVPKWAGMTELLKDTIDRSLIAVIDDRYPDPPDQTVEELKAQLAAAEAAALPKFIG